MPNRVLREGICTSETINELSLGAEVFFYRLIVTSDDYGLSDGRFQILKSKCFPLREVKESAISGWLEELSSLELILRYESGGKPYISVSKWEIHQRVRNARPKFPTPTDPDSRAIDSNSLTSDTRSPQNAAPTRASSSDTTSDVRARAHVAVPMPETFGISDEVRAWAVQEGFGDGLEAQLAYFRDYATASGKKYRDWDSAFRNCVRGDWARVRRPGVAPSKNGPDGKPRLAL